MITLQTSAEAAGQYDERDPSAVLAVVGGLAALADGGLCVTALNGRLLPVHPGDWVILYGPGDAGVMSDGAYRRFSGNAGSVSP